MYKQIKTFEGDISLTMINRIKDNATIPFDTANTDYKQYLEWLAQGNTPEQADVV